MEPLAKAAGCLTMRVNADFSQRAVVTPQQYVWVPSPQAGVERVMLDRIGTEKARATSIVRYDAASDFPAHSHPGGEEILVLSGTFSADGHDYPAGWYLRNPPGSSHRPSSRDGATIFVKLMQMSASQDAVVRVDTRDAGNWQTHAGRGVCPLFSDEHERVELIRLPANAPFAATRPSIQACIVELFVLDGTLRLDSDVLTTGSWVRLPPNDGATLSAGDEGVAVYCKAYVPGPIPSGK
ncbi:cupin domain-containing protein [Pandoraea sp. NPDC090278]|uniref:cupin domain-containing protein n=1 Tax=Pandoraea sp. NPDC090278 TaxID=3364391 RepID=UPI00383A322C